MNKETAKKEKKEKEDKNRVKIGQTKPQEKGKPLSFYLALHLTQNKKRKKKYLSTRGEEFQMAISIGALP